MHLKDQKIIVNLSIMLWFVLFLIACVSIPPQEQSAIVLPGVPSIDNSSVVVETDAFIQVEAEAFHSNDNNGTPRQWISVQNDSIGMTASNSEYMIVSPDTRITHDDELIIGTNFFPESGTGSILSYKTYFNTPGLYYVWVSCYSTGTEDNGVHVGIDGYWPESSARVQWCEGKNQWTWSSAQRVEENHCGTPNTIKLNILEAGHHTIMFSVREDGFRFDQWLMTQDKNYQPQRNQTP